MSKFFAFEMIFGDGQRFKGNMVAQYSDIDSERDVTNVETMIRQKLNAGVTGTEGRVDAVTLLNWKAL